MTGLTVSLGVATCPRDGVDRDGLIEVADRRLYRAKNLGRNQVVSADAGAPFLGG